VVQRVYSRKCGLPLADFSFALSPLDMQAQLSLFFSNSLPCSFFKVSNGSSPLLKYFSPPLYLRPLVSRFVLPPVRATNFKACLFRFLLFSLGLLKGLTLTIKQSKPYHPLSYIILQMPRPLLLSPTDRLSFVITVLPPQQG